MHFSGNLLVPVGNAINLNFIWLGTIKAADNTVYVIGFKSDKKDDFIPLMEADLKELKAMKSTQEIEAQINWIGKMLSEVSNSIWVKTPEQPMLDAAHKMVTEALRRQGHRLDQQFTRENTIYTSGVISMREVH